MPDPSTSPPAAPEPSRTKDNLLDAAERLFAQHGIARASLRAITQEAGANVAAVHYHYGSKHELVQAVLKRRLEPLNRERLERLDVAPPGDVHAILRAFIEPAMQRVHFAEGGPQFARFLWRSFSEPEEQVRDLVLSQFQTVKTRFVAALREALPQLEPADLYWNFHFVVGSMVHTAGLGHLMPLFSEGTCDAGDVDAMTDRLVHFAAAGMRTAPGVDAAPEGRSR